MELSEYCTNLATASAEAGQWVERNSDLVRNEKEGLLKELRKAGRLFRNCARAAGRKMCAGVFGPSQAGKSYLISALARGSGNELRAMFGKESHDFISEINPAGGKESTGLVTRFTMSDIPGLPDDHPVQIRLLSETDLVKIIANAFYGDAEHRNGFSSDIGATLAKLKARAKHPSGRIDLDAMEDLREYISREFGGKARVAELERSYWEEALALGPALDLEGRIMLYALLWDEVEEFTDLLRKLLGALEKLDHADTAFCSMDSLIPREASIIDVDSLIGLSGEEKGGDISIRTPAGKQAMLKRSVVTALTAELTIVMKEKPADYFDHTDLLDFPGYRSRYKFDDIRRELEKDGMLKEFFLRGKVSYLFQRYCAERELNSMLLCIGPSNQEVQDLPGVINDWVCATHGEKPEDRVGKQVALFFILTKFDMEFDEKSGAKGVESRWDTRLEASMLNFFGKGYNWPQQWTPGKGFNNMFLLRNPNFRFDAILNYDADGHETGIRAERADYVDKLHAAFLGSSLVDAHFQHPEKAWDEAMKLNDGGITYIRDSLTPLCNPELKKEQLLQNINSCRNAIIRRLSQFYQSDDKEELRKQKMLLIRNLFRGLATLEEKQHRLGQLLRAFTVNDAELYDLHSEAVRRMHELEDQEPEPIQQEEDPADIDMDNVDLLDWNPFSQSDSGEGKKTEAVSVAPARDEAAFYASYIESRWVEKLHKLADDPRMQSFFMLSPHDFSGFASELATGAARLGFTKKMEEEFRKTAAYATRKESIVRKQAAIASALLNSYIDWLGFNPQTQNDAERTFQMPGGRSVTVFNPNKPLVGMPSLAENRSPYVKGWFGDWLNALANLILDNVNFDGEQTLNVAENLALGSLLKQLGAEQNRTAGANA